MFISTKTYGAEAGFSVAFRQWRATSHCRHLHGYALSVHLEFAADVLDERGWVVDFGGLKPIKDVLTRLLDHTTLVSDDDPEIALFHDLANRGLIQMRVVPGTGCEAFANYIAVMVSLWLLGEGHAPRVRLHKVEVREHGANSAMVVP